jgi:hypothetical protein
MLSKRGGPMLSSIYMMGCMGSKISPAEKEAIIKNAKIDQQLEDDKSTLKRTTKILLLGKLSIFSESFHVFRDE